MRLRTILQYLLFIAWAILLSTSLPGTQSQTVAAGLQAIFSVAAIGVAIEIGLRESRHALEISTQQAQNAHQAMATAQRLADQRKQQSAVAIADAARDRCQAIGQAFETPDPQVALYSLYHKSVIDGLVAALSAVPVHEIGNPDAILCFLALRDQVTFFGSAMEDYIDTSRRQSDSEKGLFTIELDQEKMDRATLARNKRSQSTDEIYMRNALKHVVLINNYFEKLKDSIDFGIGLEAKA